MSTPIEETVRFLKLYNKWRRDEDETILMPDPHDIGNAIDSAVSLLESLETANADLRAKVDEFEKWMDAQPRHCAKCNKPVETCPACDYIINGCECGHCETGRYFEEDES